MRNDGLSGLPSERERLSEKETWHYRRSLDHASITGTFIMCLFLFWVAPQYVHWIELDSCMGVLGIVIEAEVAARHGYASRIYRDKLDSMGVPRHPRWD